MNKKIIESIPSDKHLDFSIIQQDLDNLIEFFVNKVEREFPFLNIPRARELFLLFLVVGRNTYRSIRYLSAEKPKDPQRKLEYAVSSIPLLRVILEEIFTVIFISDNLTDKVSWYHKAGWRELKETHNKFVASYSGNKEWEKWLKDSEDMIKELETAYGISASEVADIETIRYFPTPPQMIRSGILAPDIQKFFEYLDDSFYRQFSQAVHLNLLGLSKMGGTLLINDEEIKEDYLKKIRSDNVFYAVTLILALLTEIELNLNFGNKEKLKYLWTIVGEYWGETKELYLVRYTPLLS